MLTGQDHPSTRPEFKNMVAKLFKGCAINDLETVHSPKAQQIISAFAEATQLRPNWREDIENPLSLKELFILMLHAVGFTGREISTILGLTIITVQRYELTTRRKLKTKHRAHSFCKALVEGYLIVYP